MLEFISDSNGKFISHLRMLSSMNATTLTNKPSLLKNDSSKVEVKSQGLGACKWKLSHEGDDFKISIDWPLYVLPKERRENFLPLHDSVSSGFDSKPRSS